MDLLWQPNINEYAYTRPFGDEGWLMTIDHYKECKIHDPMVIHHSYTFVVRIHTSWNRCATNDIERSDVVLCVMNGSLWCRDTTCGCKIPPLNIINDQNWIERPWWLFTISSDPKTQLSGDIQKKISNIYPENISKIYDRQFRYSPAHCGFEYRYSYACGGNTLPEAIQKVHRHFRPTQIIYHHLTPAHLFRITLSLILVLPSDLCNLVVTYLVSSMERWI